VTTGIKLESRKGEMHTGFWWGNLGERSYLEDLDIDDRIILKWIFNIYIYIYIARGCELD